jgi:hypothetical protein
LTAAGSADEFQHAEQLLRQQHWAEARDAFDRAGRAVADCHSPKARQAVQGAVTATLQLDDWEGAWGRIRQFRQRETAQPAERRHWTRWTSETPEAKAARQAVEHFEFVRELLVRLADHLTAHPGAATAQRREQLESERIDLDFTLVRYLLGPGFETNSYGRQDFDWWWNATEPPPPENEQEDDWWGYADRGVPLGPDGRPRFVVAPERYTPQSGPGAKVRDQAARALLRRAGIARSLYGPSSDPGWDNAEFYYALEERPSFLKNYRGGRVKPFWELADNEARTRVAGRVQVIKLPETESPLALLRLIERNYPHSSVVPEAIFERGLYYQSRQQFARALDEYRALQKAYPRHARSRGARRKIEAILHADVLLGRTGYYPAGEMPTLWFAHRQTERVEFTARPFDLQRFLGAGRKAGFERGQLRYFSENFLPNPRWDDASAARKRLAPYLRKNYISWQETVPKVDRVTTQTTRAPLTEVGAYLVDARLPGGKEPSRALVVVTDLVLVHKRLAQKSLLFAADARTGRAFAYQDVHVYTEQEGKSRATTYITSQDGLIETAISSDYEAVALAISPKGGVAVTPFRPWHWQPAEQQRVGYAVTDRPVYRPGDTVHFRLWVRDLDGRTYQRPQAGQAVTVQVYDPQGNAVRALSLRTDRFGAVSGDIPLSSEAALGAYALDIHTGREFRDEPAGQFRVEMYKKPEFEVTVQPAEKQIQAGTGVRVRIGARYYFGGPVAGGHARYKIFHDSYQAAAPRPKLYDWLHGPGHGQYGSVYPWLTEGLEGDEGFQESDEDDFEFEGEDGRPIRNGEADLSDAGTVDIELGAGLTAQPNQRLIIEVEVRDASRRTIRGKGSVVVGRQDLAAFVELDRPWYGPQDQGQVEVNLHGVAGAALAVKGTLQLTRVHYRGPDHGQVRWEAVHSWGVATDQNGRLRQRLPLLPEGQYRIEFLTHDSRQQKVTARAVFWVHGPASTPGRFATPIWKSSRIAAPIRRARPPIFWFTSPSPVPASSGARTPVTAGSRRTVSSTLPTMSRSFRFASKPGMCRTSLWRRPWSPRGRYTSRLVSCSCCRCRSCSRYGSRRTRRFTDQAKVGPFVLP